MNHVEKAMKARVSRRTLFKTAGALGAGAVLAQTGFAPIGRGIRPSNLTAGSLFRSAAAETESIQDILNITVTTEAFGVTFLGAAIESARNGGFTEPMPEFIIQILEAARAQEQFHLEFFQSLGGMMLTDTFHLPDPALLTDQQLFFTTLEQQETREIAAQIAAFNTFTEMRRPDLVKVSFQYAAEEAEHRLLANYARGVRPANDRAFEPKLYETVAEFLQDLRELGVIEGTGPSLTYPGPGTIDPTNVTNRTPDGPAVMCAAPGTGGGGGRGSVVLTAALSEMNDTVGVGADGGFGFVKLVVDAERGQVCAQISVARVSGITAVTIQSASGGASGTVSLPTPGEDGLSSGCVSVDGALAQAMIENPGNFVVVVQTADNPQGVLSGQLMPLQ